MSSERVLQARLEIEAADKTGKVFTDIAKKMQILQRLQQMMTRFDKLSTAERQLDGFSRKVDGVADAFKRLETAGRAMDGMRPFDGMAAGVDKLAASTGKLDQRLRKSHENAAKLSGTFQHLAELSGPVLLKATHMSIVQGADYAHERTALLNAGRTPEEMIEIEQRAQSVAKTVPSASAADNLAVINETTGAFGSVEHALENLEEVQRLNAVLKAAVGDQVEASPKELGYATAKLAEMRGSAGNHEQFTRESEELMRAYVFYRGKANPMEMFNFATQAQTPLKRYDQEFLTRVAPALAAVWGGESAGTRANAFYNVIQGKARDKKQAQAWVDLGLLDEDKVIMQAGHAVSWAPGAVKESDLAGSNPLKWVEEVLLPAARAKGTKVDDPKSSDLANLLGLMFRNSEANRIAMELSDPRTRKQLHNDMDLTEKAGSAQQVYDRNVSSDPKAAFSGLVGALDTLMQAATSPAMENAAKAMTSLAGALTSLADVARKYPGISTTAVAGVGIVGAYGSYSLVNRIFSGLSNLGQASDRVVKGGSALERGGAKVSGAADTLSSAGIGLGRLIPQLSLLIGLAATAPNSMDESVRNGEDLDDKVRSMMPKWMARFFTPLHLQNYEATAARKDADAGPTAAADYPSIVESRKPLSEQVEAIVARQHLEERKDADLGPNSASGLAELKSALTGAATIKIELEPSRDFISRVKDMVMRDMWGFTVSGPGSAGQSSPNINR